MKFVMMAAALTLGTAAVAQTDPNAPSVPPGDGITMLGNNPEGQACTPEGFNQGLNAYPPCSALGGPAPGLEEYPPCSDRNADRCIQTYTRWTDR